MIVTDGGVSDMCSARQWQCGWCLRYNGRDCDTTIYWPARTSWAETEHQKSGPVPGGGGRCRLPRGPAGLVLVRRFSVLYTAVIRL
jgi:hypothetical protein